MSRSKLIEKRLQAGERTRKPLALVIIGITSAYLLWRLTVFSDNWAFSLLFYLAEVLAFALAVVYICSTWTYRHREPLTPPADLKVDVFLPVYKEPLEMIRQTARAACRIRYPHTTYLLDDGKRDELRELADELGLVYIRRPQNQGAKAGNMNHALEHSSGDFIAVFDADHIAQAECLDLMLGFFANEKVGTVIAPQDYYNLDGLQYMHHGKGRLWHDQSRFYNITQGCKDSYNAATSCGTGVIYRRKALEDIGGFPEITVTEDMHTTLLMHEQGYESVYFNESIAYGIAPADLADYYRTRERWAHGNLLALRLEKPWKSKKLTLKQRLSYGELGLIYMECWQQLLMFLVPILSLLFAWQPFEITFINVAVVLGLPLVMILLQDEQGCGMNRNWTAQLFAIARMPIQIVSWSAVFGRRISWKASQKNLEGRYDWRLASPQIALTAISLVALVYGLWKIPTIESLGPISGTVLSLSQGKSPGDLLSAEAMTRPLPPGYSWDLLLISSFWLIYNGARSAWWLVDIYRRTKRTHQYYRFEIPLPVEDSAGGQSSTSWISEAEIRVASAHPPQVGESKTLKLWLPAGPLEVTATVTRRDARGYEAEFSWPDQSSRDRLCDALLSVDWHSEMNQREGYFPTLIEQGLRRLRLKPRPKLPSWSPGLMTSEGKEPPALVLLGAEPGHTPSQLIGFGKHPFGEKVSVSQPDGSEHSFRIAAALRHQGICRLGLDGQRYWKSAVEPL
ncbi:MAG: glycosyltransferase [Akkermansiaceae bacterium]|nr:glycosyltransferase [Akkermansiaceae bacterium]